MEPSRNRTKNFHRKMADTSERAAEAYANELSTAKDPVVRKLLGQKARQHKEHARFHRKKGAELGEM